MPCELCCGAEVTLLPNDIDPPPPASPPCSIAQRRGGAAVPGFREYERFADDAAEIWRRTGRWSLEHTPYGLRYARWSKVGWGGQQCASCTCSVTATCTACKARRYPPCRCAVCPHAALPSPFPLQWGNLRYAANAAFTMLLRAQTLPPESRVSCSSWTLECWVV